MLNLLSYVGMSLQSELCLWTLLGLLRTIFDATLFKVNANLKQVWQMSMPAELSMPVQRVLRTIISGVMLVQCFTVYVYLAAYIVLLYPIFLEERPTLVLPWLLLAAVRRLLCELTSLAVGLGACLLMGPARPQCVRFLILKISSITPAFYMWMLVFSYYNKLKVASTFKMSPAAIPTDHPDYGLELAVRRRRTKSLLDEDQLRRSLVANFNYGERHLISNSRPTSPRTSVDENTSPVLSNQVSQEILKTNEINPLLVISERAVSHMQTFEDWTGNEITLPRDADRILEQFVVMLFRISAFLKTGASDPAKLFASNSRVLLPLNGIELASTTAETETPLFVGDSRTNRNSASYLHEYPQIFNKKLSQSESKFGQNQKQTDSGETNSAKTAINESKIEKPLRTRLTVPDKIDELNEKQLEDRQTSAIRSGELTKSHSKLSAKKMEVTFTGGEESVTSKTQRLKDISYDKYHIDDKELSMDNKAEAKIEDGNNGSEPTSVDSLQSIIERMKTSLYSTKDSNLSRVGGERNVNSERPSSSRALNLTRRSTAQDKKPR